MNAKLTSLRAARLTTIPPRHAIRNAKVAAFRHCPGDTQASLVKNIIATMPKFVGLNICLPRNRNTNLLATVIAAAAAASASEFVRKSRQSESPEIHALRGSNRGIFQIFEH